MVMSSNFLRALSMTMLFVIAVAVGVIAATDYGDEYVEVLAVGDDDNLDVRPRPSGQFEQLEHPSPLGTDDRGEGQSLRTNVEETHVPCCSGPPPPTTPQSVSTLYIRWGRTVCRRGARLVYKGIASGSHYNSPGNGANYLCLPEDPIYDQVEAGVDQYASYIYGSEYRRQWRFPKTSLGSLTRHSAPCAVCIADGKSIQYMVPAKNVCPSRKWTLEYKGYLMAMRTDWQGKTEYVCLDEDAESRTGNPTDIEVCTTFHPVESRCVKGGGLPCGPYVDGNELTCAVCTI